MTFRTYNKLHHRQQALFYLEVRGLTNLFPDAKLSKRLNSCNNLIMNRRTSRLLIFLFRQLCSFTTQDLKNYEVLCRLLSGMSNEFLSTMNHQLCQTLGYFCLSRPRSHIWLQSVAYLLSPSTIAFRQKVACSISLLLQVRILRVLFYSRITSEYSQCSANKALNADDFRIKVTPSSSWVVKGF